ncbi:MAG: 3-deoxy-D-manno-octulosonic acid transferase [Bacteroidota bacterium]
MTIYNIAMHLLRAGIWLASWIHPKARTFVSGRKNIWKNISEKMKAQTRPVVWVHCASLGEFEQGRPVIEAIRQEFPGYQLLVSFFSPSGYEVRQNYSRADYVFYLPLDLPRNARRWVELVKPTLAIFIKYEFWMNYAIELKKKNIPLLSVSTIFRPSQPFFQWYGNLFRKILSQFDHFFVQNHQSATLLKSIGFTNYTLTGDTRFDRVYQITRQAEEIAVAHRFKNDEKLMVVGSCWQEDIDVLAPMINEGQLKFILAPHEVTPTFLSHIERQLEVKYIRYSQAVALPQLDQYQVLLIDNVGMLSRLYRYGEFAYVGGAFGKGLHNILEAACYGVPIFFGNKNYQKFNEANDLIMRGGAFEIGDFADLKQKYEQVNVPETFMLACEVTKSYVEENLGATEKIMTYCRKILQA